MAKIKHQTLVASTVATVAVDAPGGGPTRIRITNRGATEVFARFDGVNPTVGGDDCLVVPGVIGGQAEALVSGATNPVSVKLISTGTPSVQVEAI